MTKQQLNNLDVSSHELLEHSERTEWRERLIIAWAKAIALGIVALAVLISLCICACRIDDVKIMVHELMNVIIGIISFYAGRKFR